MTLAKWSSKSSIKDQDDILFSTKIRELEWISLEVGKYEIRGSCIEFDDFGHGLSAHC
jgi:hypothetical protein